MCDRAERDRAIAEAFARGETRRAIAQRYNLTPRRVGQIAYDYGVLRDNPPGRPRIPLQGGDLCHYVKVRKIFGAAYARQAMGLAA